MIEALLSIDNWRPYGPNVLLQTMQILKEYETVINSIHELEPITGAFFCDKLYKRECVAYDVCFEELTRERPERERYAPWKYVEDTSYKIERRKDCLARLIKTIKERDEEEKKKKMKECEEELKKKMNEDVMAMLANN